MAKTTKSKALVPAGQRKTSVMRKATTVAAAPATDGTLLPILGPIIAWPTCENTHSETAPGAAP